MEIKGKGFILIQKYKVHRPQLWELWLTAFMFYVNLNKLHQRPAIQMEYYRPIYMNFKSDWCKKIAKYYYMTLFIIPAIIFLRIVLDYHDTVAWWVCLGLVSPITLFTLINFLRDIACKLRVLAHNASITISKYLKMRFGQPGAGKSSSAIYDSKIMADKENKEIEREYKLLTPDLDKVDRMESIARDRAKEIIEVHDYNVTSGAYPCLATTTPVYVDGVPANRLVADHLIQEEKLPYGTVGFIDEARQVLPPELHNTNPDCVLEMAKFSRQYGEFHFNLVDQAKEGAFVAWRRCTDSFDFMEDQKWVLKARFLFWLADFLTDRMKKPTHRKVAFIKVLKKIAKHIGYRKYYYTDFGNEYKQSISKTKTFILPSFLNADYDDRAYRKGYRARNKQLNVIKWNSMEFTEEQIADIHSKKIKELTKSKKQLTAEAKERTRQKKLAEKEEQKAATPN